MAMSNMLSKAVNYLWLHAWKYRAMERRHRKTVAALRGKTPVKVVFMAIDLSLWRYQHLYELMERDERFVPTIVLSPCPLREAPDQDAESLRRFFDERDIPYIDYQEGQPPYDIRGKLNPDIIFYTQPYEHLLSPEHDCRAFYDKLLCYMPYAFWSSKGKLSYDLHFHNMAWRLYYSTSLHLKEAQRTATNKGRNVCVVGYANADDYLRADHPSPWKVMADGKRRKRIIWAPHFSIHKVTGFMPRGNFLWMADLMVRLAKDYKDEIQIAFKPHPALLTQLYQEPGWGKERADNYYEQWQTMENTQLEAGQFIDLFMTSDAMVHDSGSFAVEYHYSRKPVMFVSKDLEAILSTQSDFGKLAYALHYQGKDEGDISRFIDDVVLAGHDPMLPQREQFFQDYLLPPGGKSVAQNMLDDIVDNLGIK